MTTTPTSDPLAALAAELGRIGRRLDGMGVELLTLREAGSGVTETARAPSPTEGQPVGLPVARSCPGGRSRFSGCRRYCRRGRQRRPAPAWRLAATTADGGAAAGSPRGGA